MVMSVNLPLILSAAFVASASPGPATLAIADTAMQTSRRAGLALAVGVSTGSLTWSIAAAVGMAAIMASSAWALEAMRYFGAAYLMYLALRSAQSAISGGGDISRSRPEPSPLRAYVRGFLLHLTNPKPILFFGSLYTLGISPTTSPAELTTVIAVLSLQSTLIFTGYAWLFSNAAVAHRYLRLRRWFAGAFSVMFAGASVKMLTSRLSS